MKKFVTKAICVLLLLACTLAVLPGCGSKAQTFEECYPTLDISLSELYEMDYKEFREYLSTLDSSKDYIAIYDYPRSYFFLRTTDGESVCVSTDDQTLTITARNTALRAQRKDFDAIKIRTTTVEEVIARVGFPFRWELRSGPPDVYFFPISNGSTCKIHFLDNKVWDIYFA